MKVIAYYLPQFHEVEENNIWWGKGFTEWTNLEKANKLYKNHNQPRVPLNENYYNLLEKKTVEWQTELAKNYGIEGFCYYHYWFEGRKILEKPAENLLNWKDVNQKFCFCWANHSWKKTWNGTMEMLVEQKYGKEDEWKEHIEYLLQFFKDSRYIKIENKPIFMIYDCLSIKDLDLRLEYYDKRCIENGFDGIYIIESLNTKKQQAVSEKSQAVTFREPSIGFFNQSSIQLLEYKIKRRLSKKISFKPAVYDVKEIYSKSIEYAKEYKTNKKIMLGSFGEWDSTPRHGKRGYVIENNNFSNFENYLKEQKKIMIEKKIEYVFFNAWNEWTEGMYLEPDEKNGYKYLEIIKKIIE